MDHPSFGRRGASPAVRAQQFGKSAAAGARVLPPPVSAEPEPSPVDVVPAVDEELRTWKQQRTFVIPWKQLCLMATICFGIASFVLPSTVNSAVDWLLYGLTGMSFYAWFTARRARAKP